MTAVVDALREVFDEGKELVGGTRTYHNWGGNQSFRPEHIFRPKTVDDLLDIVKKAAENKKKVRCVATGHSWSSLMVTKDYLVITKDMNNVTVQQHPKYGWTATAETGAEIAKVDEALRKNDPPLTLDTMTVLNTVRAGGVVATGSHGAKIRSGLIADEVVAMSIVTSQGKIVEFSDEKDPEEMAAARCNLGFLGIIHTVTWRAHPMFRLRTINFSIYSMSWWNAVTLKEILSRSHSLEVFYWPFNSGDLNPGGLSPSKSGGTSATPGGSTITEQDPNSSNLSSANDMLWVKQWVRTDDDVTVTDVEKWKDQFFMGLGLAVGKPVWDHVVKHPESTPAVLSKLYKEAAKATNEVLEVPDAIHYLTGINNIRVMDSEVSFKATDDFSNVIEAVSNTIEKVYDLARDGKFPLNVALEFRIHKGSRALLSNAHDDDPNAFYCALEVLSVNDTKGFEEFSSDLVLEWMDKYNGRPHWAKMWEHIPGIIPLIRETLGDRRERFNVVRQKYDPDEMFFDNDTMRKVLL